MTTTERPTYLARYLAGEHEAVWRELAALGPAVRAPAVRDDARAVARETMARVRRNVERVVPRLRAMGYDFAHPAQAHVPPTPALAARLDALEAQAGPLPLAVRAFYDTVGSVCLMGAHPRLSAYAPTPDLGRMMGIVGGALAAHPAPAASAPPPAPPALPPELAAFAERLNPGALGRLGDVMATARALMERAMQTQRETDRMIEQGGDPSPLLQANLALAGSLQARLAAPRPDGARDDAPASDPLVVWAPEDDDPEAFREFGDPDDPDARDEEGWTGRYVLDIAPDACHKANTSGGGPYQIAFPDPGADAPVLELGAPSFVAYLRDCFRWGGFPGLAELPDPPREELRVLTEGLEPF
ncbi:hypothetical protein [Roseisolibacter sp. H3M3-2]|uniref:hypothetical protein n=1 Tax=Roseisolibacter sp. H3M3-2 TaxID=3031323 RepID=UPI0023DA950F|nr:hypothetical protein [Roseisolibacter sp. H3M3-2]MDF1503438.1 hypothetical protein [Roseisolibacter sp. H3M3-2]